MKSTIPTSANLHSEIIFVELSTEFHEAHHQPESICKRPCVTQYISSTSSVL